MAKLDLRDEKHTRTYQLVVVDGMNLAWRFHSRLNLSYHGKSTSMLYGALRFVLGIREKHPEAKIIFLWEGGESMRRMKAHFYKENRRPPDNEFHRCLEELRASLPYFGVEGQSHVGLEADDMAGYLVSRFVKDNRKGKNHCLLVSNDRDWLQYAREDDTIDFSRQGAVEHYSDLKSAFGFPPERIVLWKILRGDPIDNIRGVGYSVVNKDTKKKKFVGIPSSIIRYLTNECDGDYKKILEIDLAEKNPGWQKWQDLIKEVWESIIVRNADLIMYHPEWIHENSIVVEPAEPDAGEALRILEEKGIKSLMESAERVVV